MAALLHLSRLLYYTRSKEYITLNFNKSTFASSTALQTRFSRSILKLRKGVFVRGVFVSGQNDHALPLLTGCHLFNLTCCNLYEAIG